MNRILLTLLLLPIITFSQTLAPPKISHVSGFYTDSFYVKITHPDPDVTILYTLDGSEPRIENLTGKVWNYKKVYPTNPGDAFGALLQDTMQTYEYTDSILVKDRSDEPDRYADISTSYYTNRWYNYMAQPDSVNVFKGITLRIVAYKDDLYSTILTKNYFVSQKGSARYSLPVICLTIDPDKFFSYEMGLNVPGLLFDEWRSDYPEEPIDRMYAPANFRAEGSNSEVKLNFSYIVNGAEILNQGVGIRLHGNSSRYFPNRSFRLYAKSEYGTSNFNHSFFPNYSENKFKRLILRNSGNDCQKTMFRDAFIQQASKKLHCDIQEYQPSIVFINGEYFGLYNIRERYDDKYFEQKYNIDVDDLDFLENLGVVQEGDNVAYQSLMSYVGSNSLALDENYSYISTLVDIENFTDYNLTQIFIGNLDWPTNNNEFWRKRVAYNPHAPDGHDGRWRWLLKDLDVSFGNHWNDTYEHNDLHRISTLSSDNVLNKSTLLFRRLLENESYKNYFINRFSDILNTTYKSEVLKFKLTQIKALILPEIDEFTSRWNPQNELILVYHPIYSYQAWEEYVEKMFTFAANRSHWLRNHIIDRFETEGSFNLILGNSDISHGYVKLNTININEETDGVNEQNPYPWSGIYFKNVPIKLTAIPKPGYKFSHWSGEIEEDTSSTITLNVDRDMYVKANFVLDTGEDSLNVVNASHNNIIIYPNPFIDKVNILSDIYEGDFTVYSVDGKIIRKGSFNSSEINLNDVPQGMLILELVSGTTVIRKQLIKQE